MPDTKAVGFDDLGGTRGLGQAGNIGENLKRHNPVQKEEHQ